MLSSQSFSSTSKIRSCARQRFFVTLVLVGALPVCALIFRFFLRRVQQLLLGAPFLLQHPVAYVSRSFELGRVFKFEWTVNLKFLSEDAFVSPLLSIALLALTAGTLALFAFKWVRFARAVKTCSEGANAERGAGFAKVCSLHLHPEYVVKTLFVSNIIGIVFCRSLHYQVGPYFLKKQLTLFCSTSARVAMIIWFLWIGCLSLHAQLAISKLRIDSIATSSRVGVRLTLQNAAIPTRVSN